MSRDASSSDYVFAEIPYNTGEFHPDDVGGYYFIADADNILRFFGRIDESASVTSLAIHRIDK